MCYRKLLRAANLDQLVDVRGVRRETGVKPDAESIRALARIPSGTKNDWTRTRNASTISKAIAGDLSFLKRKQT